MRVFSLVEFGSSDKAWLSSVPFLCKIPREEHQISKDENYFYCIRFRTITVAYIFARKNVCIAYVVLILTFESFILYFFGG